jgi:hypothetical protein
VLEHRLGQVEASVVDLGPARTDVGEERSVATAEIVEAETALLAVGDAEELLEPELLRLRRVPVDAARGRSVLGEAAAVVALDGVQDRVRQRLPSR